MKIFNQDNNDYPKHILNKKIILTRYNDKIFIVNHVDDNIQKSIQWDLQNDINFGNLNISITKLKDLGIYESLLSRVPIIIKVASGNERLKINSKYHQTLKKIFQSNSIPTWERKRYVMLFAKDTLLVAYSDKKMFISSDIR